MNLRQRAEKYVARVCEYLPGKFYPYEATVTINPKDAYIAGFKAAIALAAEWAESHVTALDLSSAPVCRHERAGMCVRALAEEDRE